MYVLKNITHFFQIRSVREVGRGYKQEKCKTFRDKENNVNQILFEKNTPKKKKG